MMRLRSLPPSVLCDAIEQLFSGCSVENVATAVRERLIGSGYSPDAKLHQDLHSLDLLVKAHAAANLTNIREEVLRPDISSVTKKRYDGIVAAESSPRSRTDDQTAKAVTARGIILLVLQGIKDRLEAWRAIEHELGSICVGGIHDMNVMTRAIEHFFRLEQQENWLRFIDSQSSTAGNAKQQFNIELEGIIDACIRFAKARRVITVAFDRTWDELEKYESAEEIIGVPSAPGRRNLRLLITLGRDLRILELDRAVWRLTKSGVKVPRRSVRALRTGDITSLWQ